MNTAAPPPLQSAPEQLFPDADTAWFRVLKIQIKLHQWASENPARRFDDLFNLVCDPAFLALAWDRVRGNKGARTAGVTVPVEFVREFQAGTVHTRLPDAFFDGIVAESAALPGRIWRAAFDGILAYADTDELARVTAPTLVIWGEHDALFDRTQQDRLVTCLPDARLVVYPGSGHCPNWEEPHRVAADIAAFTSGGAR